MKKHPGSFSGPMVFAGLALVQGFVPACLADEIQPQRIIAQEPFQWPWMAIAALLFFCMLLAIIVLANRLAKKNRELLNEKQQSRLTNENAEHNEHQNHLLYDIANDYIFFHDLNGNIKEINASVIRETGYPEALWKQLNIKDLVPERYANQCVLYLDRIRKKGMDSGHIRIQVPNGEELVLEYNNRFVTDQTGKPLGVRGIAKNVTDWQNIRFALKKSEEKYRNILDSIEDAYFETDLAGNITYFNKALPRLLGYSHDALLGRNYQNFVDTNDADAIYETFNYVYQTGTNLTTLDWKLVKNDNTVFHVETCILLDLDKNNQPVGFLGLIQDLTPRFETENRRKELEAQLYEARKLESIGTLAGGIAHDFNNILFPIIGYTEMTLEELPKESPLRENLEKVLKSVSRAKAMVQQILAFSRQNSDQFTEPVKIDSVIRETIKILRKTFPDNIVIKDRIPRETGLISISLPRLYQVIMNLCTNALHAMEDQSSGELEIVIKQGDLPETETARHQNMPPGEYMRIQISDNGKGIEPENLDKIFEPYFTTKPQDKGTGLGLSVSYGIVRNAGGTITVRSKPSEGACFEILLPVVDECETMSVESVDFFSPLPTGDEHILLVDDEHHIVALEKQIIESMGYRVFSRTSSIEALEAFRYDPYRFDLVVTDQTMPNMTGMELAQAILAIRPDIPIIICTGFSEKVTAEKVSAIGIKAFLTKPIPKTDMAHTIRRALDESGEGMKPAKHLQPKISHLL